MNPLNYVSAAVPENCKVKVSPSSFGMFIERPLHEFSFLVQS
jgi:hypothetical protein